MNARSILALGLVFTGAAALVFSGAAFTLQGTMISAERFVWLALAASVTGPFALLGGMILMLGFPEKSRA